MNVLLLGASGFVGKNICKCFDENHFSYIKSPGQSQCDLRWYKSNELLLREIQPDYIINCAAHVGSLNYVTKQAANVITDNAKMIISLYEAVAKICPQAIIINPVANCAYPGDLNVYSEDQWQQGSLHRSVLSYGATRRFMWAVGESYHMQYDMRSIYLMVPNMYGPYDSTDPNKAHALNALISKFVKAEYEKKEELEIWGSGIAIREWLYAEDFARVLLYILHQPQMLGLSEPVNIAQKFGLSVRELVGIIQKNFTYSGRVYYNPEKPDGAPKKIMDDARFKKVFPDFQFTTLKYGINKTIEYYKDIYPY